MGSPRSPDQGTVATRPGLPPSCPADSSGEGRKLSQQEEAVIKEDWKLGLRARLSLVLLAVQHDVGLPDAGSVWEAFDIATKAKRACSEAIATIQADCLDDRTVGMIAIALRNAAGPCYLPEREHYWSATVDSLERKWKDGTYEREGLPPIPA